VVTSQQLSPSILVEHWPSWTPDQLFAIMRKAVFMTFKYLIATTIHFGYENAVEELRSWGANEHFSRI